MHPTLRDLPFHLGDGVILVEGGLRGTFLPQVWEDLRQPRRFLTQLKRKAGLPDDYWSDTLRVHRFSTAEALAAKKPEELIRLAVRRMLPKTKLGAAMFKKLKVYRGAEHPHAAQHPEATAL